MAYCPVLLNGPPAAEAVIGSSSAPYPRPTNGIFVAITVIV